MCKSDREYLEKLKNHATETRTLLSNKMKLERERSVARAFLRAVGVSFQETELIAPAVEPTDVAFRDARFQIRDLLEPGHRRGDDWKEREKKYGSATTIDDVTEPGSSSTSISMEVLIPEVTTALSEKAQKYGAGCKNLDALIYVDLKDKFLAPNPEVKNTEALEQQGWRSVSLLFSPYGIVLFAAANAPEFLLDAEGTIKMEWLEVGTLFEFKNDS